MRSVSPNQPKTPIRGVRVPDALWEAAQAKASAEGRPLSDVIRDLLTKYVSA
jgi:predicted DNA binding CopG/RHH family protein